MSSRPPRKGFAYQGTTGSHAGFIDAIGHTPRAGANTFAAVIYDWAAARTKTGRARILRYFMQEGDEAGDYRLSMELAWCYNYPELEEQFGHAALALVLPAADLALMMADHRIYVETPEAITFDFEAWHSDASVYRMFNDLPPSAKDKYAFKLIGYLDYAMTKHQHAPRPTGAPLGFRRLEDNESLTECAHPHVRPLITECPDVSPVDADDHACHLSVEVQQSGGPLLPYIDEELAMGANDHFIKVIEHGTGDHEVYSYVEGSVLADPLSCVEVLTVEQLAAQPALMAEVRALLDKPREQRTYLWGKREFVPGWRRRTVRRRAVRRQLIIAKPVTIDALSTSMAAVHLGTFESTLKADGKLQATARLSEAANLHVVRRLLAPSRAAVEGLACSRILETVVSAAKDKRRSLDPFVVTFSFPMAWAAALSCFVQMRRDVRKRHVLVYVFGTEADFFEVLKFNVWHAPTVLEPNSFYKVVVPVPPAKVVQGDVFDGTRVPAGEFASLALDTVAQELTVKVPVAQFNASKRKRGAALGAPPPAADGVPRKFDLLSQTWVALTARAPTLGALKRAYSGLMRWVFW